MYGKVKAITSIRNSQCITSLITTKNAHAHQCRSGRNYIIINIIIIIVNNKLCLCVYGETK